MKPISFICEVQKSITCFGGGAGSGGSTTNSGPWPGQQPYLSDVMKTAQSQYQNYAPQYYGAAGTPTAGQSTVAPFNPLETGSINNIGSLGTGGSSALNSANNAASYFANGNMLSAGNPYFQSMANQVTSQMTPELMRGFTQGNTDNPNIAYAASQGLGNALGGLAYNNYNTQSQNMLNAAQIAPNIYNTQMGGLQAALQAGQAQQGQSQNQLQNLVNMWNYGQQLPYTTLNQYDNLVNGQYGVSTTSTAPAHGLFSTLFS